MITLSDITVKQYLFVVTVEANVITLGERYTNDPIDQLSLSCKGVNLYQCDHNNRICRGIRTRSLSKEESYGSIS